MASSALEEKINKIRLQNEKIRQRHEEVEADKKNAAKLNALVQLVPSDDWPERKEPPEFSTPPKNSEKRQKPSKEHNDRPPAQHYPSVQERLSKKDHKFAQGDGPPPDPKYNFLADSERESRAAEEGKNDDDKSRSRNKTPRGPSRRRGGATGGGNGSGGTNQPFFKDNRGPHSFHSKGESLPEYEAWRAERDRIDEARINRQKTAEGNWRREWDCNKVNVEKEPDTLRKGDSNRKDHDRRNSHYESDHSNRGHGGNRNYHGSQKTHGTQDYRRSHHELNQFNDYKKQIDNKQPFFPPDDRADKNIKVTVNPLNQGTVMSVKVSSPSIAGTGRVGPRQKSRVTYSSQSDGDATSYEVDNSPRQKSFDDKTPGAQQKSTPKSPFSRRKEGNSKSPYSQHKDFRGDEQSAVRPKNPSKTANSSRNEHRDQKQPNNSKPQRAPRRGANRSTAESTHIVPSSHDNAIPFEYDPTHSFDNENFSRQEIDKAEQISNESNQSNVESSEEAMKTEDSASTIEFVEQNVCNFNVEESKINMIVENNENKKVNEISVAQIDSIIKNVEEINICENEEAVETNGDETTSSSKDVEDVEKTQVEIVSSDCTPVMDKEEKKEVALEASMENECGSPNVKNDVEEKPEQIASNEELHPSISQEIKESEEKQILLNSGVINEMENEAQPSNSPTSQEIEDKEEKQIVLDNALGNALENEAQLLNFPESEETKQTTDACKEKTNDEVEKVASSIENKPIQSKEIDSTDSEVGQNVSLNDSGIVDANSELDGAKISELDTSKNLSANDSGLACDSSNARSDIDVTITEADSEKCEIKKDPQVQSDPITEMDVTKENCDEKSAEICDNSSAASNADAAVDEQVKISDDNNQATDKPSVDPTKDNDVVVTKADGENPLEPAMEKESPTMIAAAAAADSKTDD